MSWLGIFFVAVVAADAAVAAAVIYHLIRYTMPEWSTERAIIIPLYLAVSLGALAVASYWFFTIPRGVDLRSIGPSWHMPGLAPSADRFGP